MQNKEKLDGEVWWIGGNINTQLLQSLWSLLPLGYFIFWNMLNKRSINSYFKQKKYGKYNKYSKCPNIYVYMYLVYVFSTRIEM